MRDHNPIHASFEPSDDSEPSPQFESVRDLEIDEDRYSRPSLRYIDVHDRPTLIP